MKCLGDHRGERNVGIKYRNGTNICTVEMLVIDVPLMYFQSNETLHAPVTTEGIHGKNRKRHYQSARNLKLLVWSRDVLPLCVPNSHNAF